MWNDPLKKIQGAGGLAIFVAIITAFSLLWLRQIKLA
jgi:hypothetical protein